MHEVGKQKQTDEEVGDDGWIVGRGGCTGLVGGQAIAEWKHGWMGE